MTHSNQNAAKVSNLGSHVGFWLRFVSNHVSYAFARRLLSSGVTVAEWVVLREMFERESMAPSLLAEITGLTRGAVSKLADRLVAKKMIIRSAGGSDRRFQSIELSAAGRRLVPKLAAIADTNDKEFFAPLSVQERKTLMATLQKLVRAHELSKIPIE